MKCLVCDDYVQSKKDENSDCIIDFLEKIKFHYISFKTRLNESEETIKTLKVTNSDLLQTIEKLKADLILNSPTEKKKRKTNSFDSNDGSEEFPNVLAVLPDKSTDDLNEAINEENWDDTFFAPPTQTQSAQTCLKVQSVENRLKIAETSNKEINQNTYSKPDHKKSALSLSPKVLLPGNQITPLKCSPEESILPRRDKIVSAKKNTNNENKNTLNESKWISKEQTAKKNAGALEKCWNVSFLQPAKSEKNKNSSLVDISPIENRSPLGSKGTHSKLRQSKLKFNTRRDKNQATESDDTFCEEIVAASPTSINVKSNEAGKLSKMLSLRNIARQKSDNSIFVSSKKKASSLSPEVNKESAGSTPTKSRIKSEPLTSKKNVRTNLNLRMPLSPVKSDPGLTQFSQDDSSVFVLPSQSDDVICLEETDDLETNTVDLLNDIMLQENNFSDILREAELSRLNEMEKDKELGTEKISEEKKPEDFKTPIKQRKLPVFDCKECEAYFKYIGKDLSDAEIQRRLRNCCKHKKPISLHHTPEGFWDPYFRPLPPDDPRNETLIDTRFVDKKK